MYTLLEKAKVADELIYQELGDSRFDKQAKLFSLDETSAGNIDITSEHEGEDIYELLDSPLAYAIVSKANNIIIVTTGWAAPRRNTEDDEIAPSQHPERRRVLLNIFASEEGMVSTIRFSDSDEVMVEDSASGPLAEAISDLWNIAKS